MGDRKQKGFLTVTLIALTDCHISSFSLNLLNTKIQIGMNLNGTHIHTHAHIYSFISVFGASDVTEHSITNNSAGFQLLPLISHSRF